MLSQKPERFDSPGQINVKSDFIVLQVVLLLKLNLTLKLIVEAVKPLSVLDLKSF